jgi:O-antigen ligase
MCATALAPALLLTSDSRDNVRLRLSSLIAVGLIVTGLLLSGSVGSFIAAISGAMCWLLLSGRLAPALWIGPTLVGFGAILNSQLAASPLQRLPVALALYGQDSSLASRLALDQTAWSLIQQSPLFGIGLDQAAQMAAVGNVVHNMLLSVWLGAGILGLVGALVILVSAIAGGITVFRHGGSYWDRQLALAFLASMLTVLLLGLSSPLLYQRYAWLPALMLIALRVRHARPNNERPR